MNRRLTAVGRSELIEKIEALESALTPFAAIADEWEGNGLDESRPYWIEKGVEAKCPLEEVELYTGRGGKTLMTLAHVFAARAALRGG